MNKWLRRALIVLVALGIGYAGVKQLSRPQPVAVVLAKVEKGLVESSVANTRAGTVNACRRAHVSPAVGGQVAKLKVKKGQLVAENQILLELWNDELSAQLQLADRENTASQATAAQACLQADAADRDARRFLELQKSKLASDESVDRAVTTSRAQQAGCRAAQAMVTVQDAKRSATRAAFDRTIVRAPFAGRIAELNVEAGEYVTPSPPGILTLPAVDLVDASCLYVTAPLDEVDAPKVQTGLLARIVIDAFPGRVFAGRVGRIADYVLEKEKQARTVDVEVEFADPREREALLPGYSADIEIVLSTRENVLRIPTGAVIDGKRVLRFDATNKTLTSVDVVTGIRNWKFTEVLSGLAADDEIVTSVDRQGVVAGASVVRDMTGKPEGRP